MMAILAIFLFGCICSPSSGNGKELRVKAQAAILGGKFEYKQNKLQKLSALCSGVIIFVGDLFCSC